MSKKSFEKFVNQQIASSDKPINRDAELAEWQSNLELLYQIIESFLQEFISQGRIKRRYQSMQIHEDLLGEYTVRSMEIEIGSTSVRLEPIGTYLIGVKGRVDMIGSRGTARLVLVDKDSTGPKIIVKVNPSSERAVRSPPVRAPEWTWKIVTNGTRIRYQELTADSFYSSLMDVSRG